ncbi:MAG: alcohol dehydrogenase [Cryobacterium sp.]|nr:alcohol dehydrogenase [Cryobacterium sp.]
MIAVGSDPARLQTLQEKVPGIATYACDLSSWPAVVDLAASVRADHGSIDGLIHLVGGWRGGGGLAGQTDEDWEFLHTRVVATLRNTTRAFHDDLLASPAGRLAIVSSVTVAHPTPGGANYATAKAAAETWTKAIGNGFAKSGTAASAIFVVNSLDGLEELLAEGVVGLWRAEPSAVNNTYIPLHAES